MAEAVINTVPYSDRLIQINIDAANDDALVISRWAFVSAKRLADANWEYLSRSIDAPWRNAYLMATGESETLIEASGAGRLGTLIVSYLGAIYGVANAQPDQVLIETVRRSSSAKGLQSFKTVMIPSRWFQVTTNRMVQLFDTTDSMTVITTEDPVNVAFSTTASKSFIDVGSNTLVVATVDGVNRVAARTVKLTEPATVSIAIPPRSSVRFEFALSALFDRPFDLNDADRGYTLACARGIFGDNQIYPSFSTMYVNAIRAQPRSARALAIFGTFCMSYAYLTDALSNSAFD